MLRPILFAALALATPLATAPVLAQAVETKSVAVPYADLALGTDAGRARLNVRIARAVTAVCGALDTRNLAEQPAIRACRARAGTAAAIRVAALTGAAGNRQLAAATPR